MMISYHKRKLPHIQVQNMPNFITFRTYKSIDSYVKKLTQQNEDTKIKQYKIDKYLDNSDKGAYLYDKELRILKNILHEKDNLYYYLISYAIMPNHVHLLIEPKKNLAFIMKSIKGKSAKLINESLKMNGSFWAREYYDKVLRNDKQINNTIRYIINNPIKANLNDAKERIFSKFKIPVKTGVTKSQS